MVRNTPAHDHLLLGGGEEMSGAEDVFSTVRGLPRNPLLAVRAVRAAVAEYAPDLVYAHSSFAGAYTRATRLTAPTIYQPHCFVFDDPERGRLARVAYRLAERALAARSAAIVTLSPHESRLAAALRPGVRTESIPNVPTVPVRDVPSGTTDAERLRVVMIGRVAPQKSPEFFAAVAKLHRERGGSAEFVWIGDGDEKSVAMLRDAGCRVTGWLAGDGVTEELDAADVYLHAAGYEGFPLSVLDAAARRVPVVVRDLPCFEGFGLRTVADPDAAERAVRSASDPAVRVSLQHRGDRLIESMNDDEQARALDALFAGYGPARAGRAA